MPNVTTPDVEVPADLSAAKEAMRARLRRLLTAQQIRVLGSWQAGESAAEIARQVRRSRRTVRDWIAFALQRCADACIELPPRMPPRPAGREVFVEPAAMDRLVEKDGVGKWINAAQYRPAA